VAGVLATRIRKLDNKPKRAEHPPQVPPTDTKNPMTSFCWGQQGRELITELQRSNWLPPYNVSAFSKVLAFVCFPFSNPATKFKHNNPSSFFLFLSPLPCLVILVQSERLRQVVEETKTCYNEIIESLGANVACKTKDKRQL